MSPFRSGVDIRRTVNNRPSKIFLIREGRMVAGRVKNFNRTDKKIEEAGRTRSTGASPHMTLTLPTNGRLSGSAPVRHKSPVPNGAFIYFFTVRISSYE